ncbi:MAG TPA: cellulose biosynthesis protein BcsS, partial [Saliniramus sp.]|nr:cellulose biosynthesis protein BcsS [Saliniramus sp.]
MLLAMVAAAIADPDAETLAETKAERQLRQVIFSSIEFANGSAYVGSGFKRAFGKSIDEQGFVLMSLSGAGATPEIFEGPADVRIRVARLSNSASMMLGYQWVAPGRVVMLAAGPESSRSQEIGEQGRPR